MLTKRRNRIRETRSFVKGEIVWSAENRSREKLRKLTLSVRIACAKVRFYEFRERIDDYNHKVEKSKMK